MKRQSECNCKVKCERFEYKPSLSYAQLSKFNIDRMVLNDPERRAAVNAKFLRAREISQRVILDVAEEDRVKLLDIKEKLEILWEDMKVVGPAFESDVTFGEQYQVLPIIENGDNEWRGDYVAILTRYLTLAAMYGPVLSTPILYMDKWIPGVVFNLLEMNTDPEATPGIYAKLAECLNSSSISFPLPEYDGEVKQYFRERSRRRRRKRSHVEEHPGLVNFFAVDAPEYEKAKELADCNDYLSLKQDMAEALIDHRDLLEADIEHVQTIKNTFDTFFAYLYQNTSKSPTEMEKYTSCKNILDEWDSTLSTRLDAMVNAMEEFIDLNDTVDIMSVVTHLLGNASYLVEDAAYTFQGKLYINCYWVWLELLSKDDRGQDWLHVNRYDIDLNNAYLAYATIRTSFFNIADYARGIHDVLDTIIVPSLGIIDDYLAERVTKMDMAQVVEV